MLSAVAGWVVYTAILAKMEWLAIVGFIVLLQVLLPNFLADVVNRLRPFRFGQVEAPHIGARQEMAPEQPLAREERIREEIDRRIAEIQKDLTFQFQPVAYQQLYAEVAALAVRVEALEEVITEMRGGK